MQSKADNFHLAKIKTKSTDTLRNMKVQMHEIKFSKHK